MYKNHEFNGLINYWSKLMEVLTPLQLFLSHYKLLRYISDCQSDNFQANTREIVIKRYLALMRITFFI